MCPAGEIQPSTYHGAPTSATAGCQAKKAPGASCAANDWCISASCVAGKCSACSPTHFLNPTDSTCKAKNSQPVGASCSRNDWCASATCVGGRCCASDIYASGGCTACDASAGKCESCISSLFLLNSTNMCEEYLHEMFILYIVCLLFE